MRASQRVLVSRMRDQQPSLTLRSGFDTSVGTVLRSRESSEHGRGRRMTDGSKVSNLPFRAFFTCCAALSVRAALSARLLSWRCLHLLQGCRNGRPISTAAPVPALCPRDWSDAASLSKPRCRPRSQLLLSCPCQAGPTVPAAVVRRRLKGEDAQVPAAGQEGRGHLQRGA
jgi:hypothetical protein